MGGREVYPSFIAMVAAPDFCEGGDFSSRALAGDFSQAQEDDEVFFKGGGGWNQRVGEEEEILP